MRPLPIDPLLPEIAQTLGESKALVLRAEPGAGKTTRVPYALYEADAHHGKKIVVTEPRRLAARLAASFVASERGVRLGTTVGYSVRFEHRAEKETTILYVTEGVLLRRLIDDPSLGDVGVLVLDEFHERHLATDVLLALALRLQRTTRPDLRLVVMSATLDAAAIAAHIGAPLLESRGRAFPLTVEHAERPDDRPIDKRVASAVRALLEEEPSGDILTFLPGAREIRQVSEALSKDAAESGVLVLPLHGDLSVAEQARAVEPAQSRKVILSTNVAESSVTVEGVTLVVDSGLARVAGHSPWSGLPTLRTAKISRASAIQRAGRAARTGPGRVVRLYTSGDFATRPEHDAPEISRDDLSETFLSLHGIGVGDPVSLPWLDAPPKEAVEAAERLLRSLRALDGAGVLTDVGRDMLAFPLPPRLARLVVEGERSGVGEDACLAAALLSERDIRLEARSDLGARGDRRRGSLGASGSSDVLELMDRYREAGEEDLEPRSLSRLGLDARAVKSVERTTRQLRALLRRDAERPDGIEAIDRALERALFAAFPDRLAKRRNRTDRSLVLANGKTATLSEASVVNDETLLVALDAEEAAGRGVTVRLASRVEPAFIFELAPDLVDMSDDVVFNADTGVVEQSSRIAAGSVVLEEERRPAPASDLASALLAGALRAKRPPWYEIDDRVASLRNRVALLREHVPEARLETWDEASLDRLLVRVCEGLTRVSEFEELDVAATLLAQLPGDERALVERETPESVALPGGRRLTVNYPPGRPPWVESRLQDFFGMTRAPVICRGRLPLTLHLLAPNHRAVQVTTDLDGFWERHYSAIRRELSRRYPRHPWPEDGRTATPPAPKNQKPR